MVAIFVKNLYEKEENSGSRCATGKQMDEACTHTAEALAVENPIGGNSDRGTRTGEPGLGEPGLGEPGLWGTRTGGTRTMGNPAYG